MAVAAEHQPKHPHVVQFSNAERRCRDVATGSVAAVRGRHCPDHAHSRWHPVGGTEHRADRTRQGKHRQAGPAVCDGVEIGGDTDQLLKGGARYYDKRPMAKRMWATIMGALKAVGAISKEAA